MERETPWEVKFFWGGRLGLFGKGFSWNPSTA